MFAYMTVASIDSSSQIHLSGVISTSGTQTFTFWPLGITDPSFSTFVLPDLRGRYPTGADPTGAGGMPVNKPVLGAYIGEEQHTLTVAEIARPPARHQSGGDRRIGVRCELQPVWHSRRERDQHRRWGGSQQHPAHVGHNIHNQDLADGLRLLAILYSDEHRRKPV